METLPTTTDLGPRELQAVELYTDPTSPSTFGNKKASLEKAGLGASNPSRTFARPGFQMALEEADRRRLARSDEVAELLQRFASDAAMDLVRQLGLGQELQVIDPLKVFGSQAFTEQGRMLLSEEDSFRLREISRHNTTVANLVKVRQKAQELLLAYAVGTPEQRMRHVHEKKLPDAVDLSKLAPEELAQLGEAIEQAIRKNAPQDPEVPEGVVVEVEVLD